MRVSVITPTCDRPIAFALTELWMARQTRQPDEWLVVDSGTAPVVCTMGQWHLRVPPSPRGIPNFLRNLRQGVTAATGDVLVWMEDDDYYTATHLERICEPFEQETVMASGDDLQNYYNLPQRLWRAFDNRGASLCQTAFRRSLIPLFVEMVDLCGRIKAFGVDGHFWARVAKEAQALRRTQTCVGMKGLPGTQGLGIGHRPTPHTWHADPSGAKLRELVGSDSDVYLELMETAACR